MGKANINKRVIPWHKSMMEYSMFYNGMTMLRVVSFPTKSLENELEVKPFRCGCGPWS